ncbi:hypothetical protein OROMI_024186 [Orobanche minor]
MLYANSVKADVERIIRLELDDLEIDEEEKYSRKLDSRLYILQVNITHLIKESTSRD